MHDDIALLHPTRFLVSGVMSANLNIQSSLFHAFTNYYLVLNHLLQLLKSENMSRQICLAASANHFSFILVGKSSINMLIKPNNEKYFNTVFLNKSILI